MGGTFAINCTQSFVVRTRAAHLASSRSPAQTRLVNEKIKESGTRLFQCFNRFSGFPFLRRILFPQQKLLRDGAHALLGDTRPPQWSVASGRMTTRRGRPCHVTASAMRDCVGAAVEQHAWQAEVAARGVLCDSNTPRCRVRCIRGGGTSAANRAIRSSGAPGCDPGRRGFESHRPPHFLRRAVSSVGSAEDSDSSLGRRFDSFTAHRCG